jgi:hypothetical protein
MGRVRLLEGRFEMVDGSVIEDLEGFTAGVIATITGKEGIGECSLLDGHFLQR